MATEQTPARSTLRSEVTVVSITVLEPRQRRGRPLRERLRRIAARHRALTLVGTTLAVAVPAAMIATALLLGEPTRSAAALGSEQVSRGQRAEIAAQLGYPYPPRCLTITIVASDPDYARANVDRTGGCGRYHGYVNASLHRVAGSWRLMLDEGQLFVPNGLLSPCPSATMDRNAGCHADDR